MDVLRKRGDTGIGGTPFYQHLFDVTPLLEHELVLHPIGVIIACNVVGILDSLPKESNPRARDPVADFKRGIKRDPSQIPILEEQKQLDNWQRTTKPKTSQRKWTRLLLRSLSKRRYCSAAGRCLFLA
jgi:hypothetical protein